MPALADTVVLDPCWLTADVLGPLLSPTVENLANLFESSTHKPAPDGSVPMASLAGALSRRARVGADQADEIVEMMFRLGLCVVARDHTTVMVPSLATVAVPLALADRAARAAARGVAARGRGGPLLPGPAVPMPVGGADAVARVLPAPADQGARAAGPTDLCRYTTWRALARLSGAAASSSALLSVPATLSRSSP